MGGEPRQGHIAVDVVAALGLGVAGDVIRKSLPVLVKVEGELGVIEHSVLLDLGIEGQLGGFLETLHSLDLVLQLKIGVSHLVGSDLAEGVGEEGHPGEIVHSTGVVLDRIEHGAGVEVVGTRPGLVGEAVLVEVFLGLVDIALHEVGLGEDAGEMRLALGRNLLEHRGTVLGNVAVVLVVEAALEDVVIGVLGETGILGGLLEPVDGGVEVAGGIVDVAYGIAGRGGVVGEGHLLHRDETLARAGVILQRIVAVGALEHVLGHMVAAQLILGDGGELPARGGIVAGVEESEALLEMDLRGKRGLGIFEQIRVQLLHEAGRLHPGGAEGGIPLPQDVALAAKVLEDVLGALVHSVTVQPDGLPVVLVARSGLCLECKHPYAQSRGNGEKSLAMHKKTFISL